MGFLIIISALAMIVAFFWSCYILHRKLGELVVEKNEAKLGKIKLDIIIQIMTISFAMAFFVIAVTGNLP